MPADAESSGQLRAQAGVIDRRQRLLIVLDQPSVQRQPTPIRRLHSVGDHQMRVQLRVQCSTGVLSKRSGDDPSGVDHGDIATDPVAGVSVTFDPHRQRANRIVVRRKNLLSGFDVTECEQHGHGLRRRCCYIEPADRLVVVAATEMAIRSVWIHAGHQRDERFIFDLAGQPERRRAIAEPDAAGLARLEVVVRQLLHVVVAGIRSLQRGHAHGHYRTPFSRVSVHSSIRERP